MASTNLSLPRGLWPALRKHLVGSQNDFEEAAFVFAAVEERASSINLRALEWYAVPPGGFEIRSPYLLELSDETRAGIIKRAHDLGAALVEFHSHPQQVVAEFSLSDLTGFTEFVPHVRWRLRRRPYAAVVMGVRTFDGLVWFGDSKGAYRLDRISAEGRSMCPTGATRISVGEFHGSV